MTNLTHEMFIYNRINENVSLESGNNNKISMKILEVDEAELESVGVL